MNPWKEMPAIGNVSSYISAISRFPMLTAEEECELATQLPNEEAKSKLVFAHLRLAMSMARKYSIYGQQVEDLIQEANMALLKAADRYDGARGRFASWAIIYINSALSEYSIKNDRIVNIASTKPQRKILFNMSMLKKKYEIGDGGRKSFTEKQVAEISALLNVPERDVRDMEMKMQAGQVSLSTPLSVEFTVEDTLEDSSLSPLEILERAENDFIQGSVMTDAIAQLDERSQFIINARYIDVDENGHGLGLADIGTIYNISGSRVQQIEKAALKKLRTMMIEYA